MSKLVEEGLIAPETFVQHNDQLKALAENPDAPVIGMIPSGYIGMFSVIGDTSATGRFADWVAIAPFEGPDGVRYSNFNPPAVAYHTKITNVAKRPDIIAQWADWFYEDNYVHKRLSWDFAREGIDWRRPTDEELAAGVVSRDGTPAQMIPIEKKEGSYGVDKVSTGWTRTAPYWLPHAVQGMPLEWANDPSKIEWNLMAWTRDFMQPYAPKEAYMPPNLVFDASVTDEMADLTEALVSSTGVVMQWSTEFIVGTRDITDDGEWDAYLRELKRAGVDRYVKIWQETITNAGY